LSWGSRSIVKMEMQNENARKFYLIIDVAQKALGDGRPVGEVDSLLSTATSHYLRTPEIDRVPDMRKKIDNLELDVSHWRSEE
jgi:hypothetical protein